MNLPEFSIRKPVSIIVVMLIFITIGVISMIKLPLEMMPDTSFPGLMVQVPYPSSSPEEVERIITRPLEDILATVNNLESLSSTSSSSSSNGSTWSSRGGPTWIWPTMQIRDKIDQIRDDSARRHRKHPHPALFHERPAGDQLQSVPAREIWTTCTYWSENYITQQLERIEGVANVDIRGIRNKVLTIYLKPEVFYSSSIRI